MSCVVDRGPHDLVALTSKPAGSPGVELVLRWCCKCGAVVVDLDIDGRVQPGGGMPMRFPKLAIDGRVS